MEMDTQQRGFLTPSSERFCRRCGTPHPYLKPKPESLASSALALSIMEMKMATREGEALTFRYYYYRINREIFRSIKYYILYDKNNKVEYIELFLDNVTHFFL